MRIKATPNGFTLLETLIAITIMISMAMIIWQISSRSMQMSDKSQAFDERYQAGRVTMQRLASDLAAAFMLGASLKSPGEDLDQAIKETAFIGANSASTDSVYFASFSHVRLKRNAAEGDQHEVGYYVETDSENPDELALKRSEAVHLDGKIREGGKGLVMARHVTAFNLSYYNRKDNEWVEEWDSTSRIRLNELPGSCRIELRMKHPKEGEDDLVFTTTVNLALAASPIEF